MPELKDEKKEELHYKVVVKKDNPAECVIQKTGMIAEFTLGDINADIELLKKKREEVEGIMKISEARLINIDNTNPEIGEMSEELRQVIFIYAKDFSTAKVAKEKIAEIDAAIKSYRQEALTIAMETGISVKVAEDVDNSNGKTK